MKPFSYFFALAAIFALSCQQPIRQACFLRAYPKVFITGFDTLQIDSVLINKFAADKGFDSLLSFNKVSVHDQYVFVSPDSFFITPYLNSIPYADFYQNAPLNFEIIFANGRRVKISNLTYDNNVCPRGDGEFPAACVCSYLACTVDTSMCSFYTMADSVFIVP